MGGRAPGLSSLRPSCGRASAGIGPVAAPHTAPIAMVLAPTRLSIPAAALQRIGAPQEDPVLLLEAALRAVQALMLQRGPRMWRRCWIDQPYVREERELIRTELLPPLVRAMEELAEIDLLLIRRQPIERSLQVERLRDESLQGLIDGFSTAGRASGDVRRGG